MAGLPIGTRLNEWLLSVGGLTFGEVDEFGVEWIYSEVEGWDGGLDGATEVTHRPADHGAIPNPWEAEARPLTIRGSFEAPTVAAREAAEARFNACVPGAGSLLISHRSAAQQMRVLPNGKPLASLINARACDFELPIVAPDPRKYSTTVVSGSTGLPATTGGLTLPFTIGATTGLTNHVPNPSFEAGIAGWSGVGGALSRVTVGGWSGSSFVRFTEDAAAGRRFVTDPLPGFAAETVTAQSRIKGTPGQRAGLLFNPRSDSGSLGFMFGPTQDLTGDWQQVVYTDDLPAGTTHVIAGLTFAETAEVAGNELDADGIMLTKGATVPDYGDGDSDGWVWDGTPHASTSHSTESAGGLVIGATVSSGRIVAVNEGNFETPPTLTVHGPCPPHTLTCNGRALRYPASLAAGRTLVYDTLTRRALLDGRVARTVTGSWFRFEPGSNEVGFSAATHNAGALLTSEHRHASR